MIKFLKNTIYIIFFLILFCYLWYLTLHVGEKIFIEKNHDYIVNALGSFFGAFWVFLFMLFADFVKNKNERIKIHVNSLVRLEHRLNKIFAINGDNLFEVKGFIKKLEEENFIVPATSLKLWNLFQFVV